MWVEWCLIWNKGSMEIYSLGFFVVYMVFFWGYVFIYGLGMVMCVVNLIL